MQLRNIFFQIGVAFIFIVSQVEGAHDDCIVFRGDLLYAAPSFEETYFVINGAGLNGAGNPTPNGKRIHNRVGFNTGFRLEGMYGFPHSCVEWRLVWTHLYATSKKTVSNHSVTPQLWPTSFPPSLPNINQPFSGSAHSHIGVMNQKGECLLDEKAWNIHCWNFALRQGIEWSYIRYHEKITYIVDDGSSEKVEFHAHTKGLGAQIGVLALCEPRRALAWFPCDLSIMLMTTGSLIPANSKAKMKAIDALGVPSHVSQNSFWKLIPEWHLLLELRYSHCFRACRATINIGYEMTTYFRGTSKLIFDETTHPGHSFNQYCDFYVQGYFLGFTLVF